MTLTSRTEPRHRVVAAAVTTLSLVAGLLVAAALTVGIPPGAASMAAAASCGTTNVALGKTATASSTENASFPASAAVDGNTGTRWSSAFSDPQWLEVDLGSSQSICQVTLDWDFAAAYGPEWAFLGQATPHSVMLAVGSAVAVSPLSLP